MAACRFGRLVCSLSLIAVSESPCVRSFHFHPLRTDIQFRANLKVYLTLYLMVVKLQLNVFHYLHFLPVQQYGLSKIDISSSGSLTEQ